MATVDCSLTSAGPCFRLKLKSAHFELCRFYIFLIVNCSLILPNVNSYGVTPSAGFGNDDNGKMIQVYSHIPFKGETSDHLH